MSREGVPDLHGICVRAGVAGFEDSVAERIGAVGECTGPLDETQASARRRRGWRGVYSRLWRAVRQAGADVVVVADDGAHLALGRVGRCWQRVAAAERDGRHRRVSTAVVGRHLRGHGLGECRARAYTVGLGDAQAGVLVLVLAADEAGARRSGIRWGAGDWAPGTVDGAVSGSVDCYV